MWDIENQPRSEMDEIASHLEIAGSLLSRWHEVYHPGDTSWGPFAAPRLFQRVDFVAERCSELRYVFATLYRLSSEMLPELHRLERETPLELDVLDQTIGQLRIQLKQAIATYEKEKGMSIFQLHKPTFCVFSEECSSTWRSMVVKFRTQATEILGIIHRYHQKQP